MYYPDRHHPIFFIEDELRALGATVEYTNRDARTKGCYGLIVNGKVFVWLIDNRWMHERATEDPAAASLLARGALVCCAQRQDAERVGAKWLPLAVTPGYTPPALPDMRKDWDIGFVGYVRDAERGQILRYLMRYFSTSITEGIFGDDAVDIYRRARIGVNVPTQYGNPLAYDSANMRCFEILGTGTPLLTPHEDYLSDLGLIDGVTCYTYHNWREIGDRLRELLRAPLLINSVGTAGLSLARDMHTYKHRARKVLEWLK